MQALSQHSVLLGHGNKGNYRLCTRGIYALPPSLLIVFDSKAQVAYQICEILEQRKLTQKEAASVLGIDQPKVSALLRGRLQGFSSDRLFRFLNGLDRDVEIVIRSSKKRRHRAGIRVLLAA